MDLKNFLSRHESVRIANEFGVTRMTVWRALGGYNSPTAEKIRSRTIAMIDEKLEEWKKNRELFINEGRLPADM